MEKRILLANDDLEVEIDSIITFLNSASSYFKFERYDKEVKIEDNIISSHTYQKLDIKIDNSINIFVILTNKPYYNNFFIEEQNNIAIVSFFKWKHLTSLSKNNGVIFFVMALLVNEFDSSFRHSIDGTSKPECIFDFLIDKQNIDSSMRASAICPVCNDRIKIKINSENGKLAFEDIKTILNELGSASKWDEDILAFWNKKTNQLLKNKSKQSVFISYSHVDAEWLKRVKVHLKPLERDSIIEIWEDTRIKTGDNWKNEIELALKNSKAAILLLSADFLASDFIVENELPQLLKIAKEEGTRIFQVILSPCCFDENENLSQFQAVNSPNKSLIEMDKGSQERLLVQLAKQILTHVKN